MSETAHQIERESTGGAHALGVVIAAGGHGRRFGSAEGKQLSLLGGRPVVSWAVEAFSACEAVSAIVLVSDPDRLDEYAERVSDFVGPSIAFEAVPGGRTRQESVRTGLDALPVNCGFVAVHDGARPFVTPALISSAFAALTADADAQGVVVGHPAVDTLKHVERGVVVATPDRTLFWSVQTPQIFRAAPLRLAHDHALTDGFLGTDDSALLERLGGRVLAFEGPRDNIKITHAEDLLIAESILAYRNRRA